MISKVSVNHLRGNESVIIMITSAVLLHLDIRSGDHIAKIKCVKCNIIAILSCHSGPHKWPQHSGQTISLLHLLTRLLSSVFNPKEMAALRC